MSTASRFAYIALACSLLAGCKPDPPPTAEQAATGGAAPSAAADDLSSLSQEAVKAIETMGRSCRWMAKESFITTCPNNEQQRLFERLNAEWRNDPAPLEAMAALLHHSDRKVMRAAARIIHFTSDHYISTGLSKLNPNRAAFASKTAATRMLDALATTDTQTASDIVRGCVFVATAAGMAERTFEVLDGRTDPGGWPRRMGYRASLRFGGLKMIAKLDELAKSGAKHDVQHALSATKEMGELADGDKATLCKWVYGYIDDPVGRLSAAQFVADACDADMQKELLDQVDAELAAGRGDAGWLDIAGRIAGRGAPHDERALAVLRKKALDRALPERTRLGALDALRRHASKLDATRAICKLALADPVPVVKDTAKRCLEAFEGPQGPAVGASATSSAAMGEPPSDPLLRPSAPEPQH